MFAGKQIGPFRVEYELGSGAMGTVYRALDTRSSQPVAIKFIAPGLGENDRVFARFEREAEMLKTLKHPSIVRRIATGRYHKTPFFVMEFVEGRTLEDVLKERGQLPWDEVVEIGKQVCSALAHAHSFGIIHRDLKPANLMMTRDGVVKLTDFGIAKDLDAEGLTSANCTVGTAAYMSPEQCRGERDLTAKSDLYSLGIVLYELLTGRKPFHADNVMDMFMMHVKGPFERPSRFVMDTPVWLDTLICQLMEKDPDQRPLNASMVEQVLNEVREKMDTLRSAGADVARKVARKGETTSDRRAAQSIIAGRKKKRKKRFNYQKVLMAVGLVVALGGLIGLIVYGLQPPGVEKRLEEAERLVQKGMELIESSDPDAAKEPWYDATWKLRKIEAEGVAPFAERATKQLAEIEAGQAYLLIRGKIAGKNWGQIAGDADSFKRLQEQYEGLLKRHAASPFAERARKEMEPFEVPALLEQAKKLAEEGIASWDDALERLATLRRRYPSNERWKEAESDLAWLLAYGEGKAIAKRVFDTKVPRTPTIGNDAENEALQALELEHRAGHDTTLDDTGKQQIQSAADQIWARLAQQPGSKAEELRWIELAKRKAAVKGKEKS